MLKFLKGLVDTVKEGIAEGRAELAQEQAQKQADNAARRQALDARLATASPAERFAVVLAAPYRQVFSSELRDAREEGRQPVHMLCCEIAESEIESWTKLLARDFDVSDADSAKAAAAAFVAEAEATDAPDGLALITARLCHLATASAAVGHTSKDEALAWLAPVALRAATTFEGWEDYGSRFLAGERDAPGSNVLGRKVLRGAVGTLLEDELSPWKIVTWPRAMRSA